MPESEGLISFLKSRTFFKHLAIASAVAIIIVIILFQLIKNFTDHGESVKVPNFKGLKISEIDNFILDKPFRYVITDSIYDLQKPKGTVVEQTPAVNFNVKENRTIYLTVNATQPPKIKMPDLIDASLRQAISILETYGLKVGRLDYKPDFAKNAVLEQHYRGKKIQAGTSIVRGSTIDLVLGDGLGDEQVSIPMLIGLTRTEALNALNLSSLTIGSEVFDDGADSTKAKVYKQSPAYSTEGTINMGTPVNLFYTTDESKIKTLQDTAKGPKE